MRILDDHEWPFGDPALDVGISRMRTARAASDTFESILDVDASMSMLPSTAMITVSQATSIMCSIGTTICAIDALLPTIDDAESRATLGTIKETFIIMHAEYVRILTTDSGTLLVEIAA